MVSSIAWSESSSTTIWWSYWTSLTHSCHYRRPSVSLAVLYCFSVSTAFVLALYLLVPRHIRLLQRDDPVQIQRRMVAISIVCILVISTHPIVFCKELAGENSKRNVSALQLMGWTVSGDATSYKDSNEQRQEEEWTVSGDNKNEQQQEEYHELYIVFGVMMHSIVLYLGPIVAFGVRVYVTAKPHNVSYGSMLMAEFKENLVPGNRSELYQLLRNLVFAPLSEEVVFRGCIVPPLLACKRWSYPKVALLAPLFFGTAHVHHAYTRLRGLDTSVQQQKRQRNLIMVSTIIQFAYTSLFGSYVAYAFLRTGSIVPITLSHAFCNFMGLPNLTFWTSRSSSNVLYQYRWLILSAYLLGVYGFYKGFGSTIFMPQPPLLVSRMMEASLGE